MSSHMFKFRFSCDDTLAVRAERLVRSCGTTVDYVYIIEPETQKKKKKKRARRVSTMDV